MRTKRLPNLKICHKINLQKLRIFLVFVAHFNQQNAIINPQYKPLNDTTLLTPYEQYFIQTLHQEDQLIPEQFAGEQNPLLQFAIDPTYTPLEETSQVTPVSQYT